ncbi:MAG: rRNA pseudouridine synthase [Erysipelotrichales bacterium]|nr:rRNA pseudouridine synthase [Erysipelotrichales bacterium]
MRIDKYLSNLKYGSRSEIKALIKANKITVNNQKVSDSGLNIDPAKDIIKVFEEEVLYRENVYLLLNKPSGYLSATKDNLHKTVLDLIKAPFNRFDLKICGRLDLDTEGLLILTNDTEFIHNFTNPKKDILKKYYCLLRDKLKDFEVITKGVILKDGKGEDYFTKPCKIEPIDDYSCYIYLSEGKFHQVKRLFQYINNEVVYLKRLAIGEYNLPEELKLGEYLEFRKEEKLCKKQ